MCTRTAPLLALLLALCLPALNGEAAHYAVTDLGTLDGMRSRATGINDVGQVVGNLYDPSTSSYRAFLWQDGVMTALSHPEGSECRAADINNAGQIVGEISDGDGGYREACLWHDGSLTLLGTLPWEGRDEEEETDSWATCINEAGQVAGSAHTGAPRARGFLWQDGVMTDLGPEEITSPLDDWLSEPQDINNNGQIVGWRYIGLGWWDAYMWEGGVTTPLGSLTRADAINDAGQIIGYHSGIGSGVVWRNGAVEYVLGLVPGSSQSIPNDINNSGQVVGVSHSDQQASVATFIWQGGLISDLNDLIPSGSGWALYEATAINELGQIVGNGKINGEFHAFLLTPIPEPGVLALALLGLAALAARAAKGHWGRGR